MKMEEMTSVQAELAGVEREERDDAVGMTEEKAKDKIVPKHIVRFRLFGRWFVFAMAKKKMNVLFKNGKSFGAGMARHLRYEMCGHVCECCGRPLPKFGYLVHTLPAGAEGRNAVDNVRMFCGECYHELQKKPHVTAIQYMETYTKP